MFCTRIYDFIRETDVRLAAPEAGDRPQFSLLKPDADGLALVRRHQNVLMALEV